MVQLLWTRLNQKEQGHPILAGLNQNLDGDILQHGHELMNWVVSHLKRAMSGAPIPRPEMDMLPEDDQNSWYARMDRLAPGSRHDLDQMLPTDMGLTIGFLITTGASGNFTRRAREMGLPVEFWAFSLNRKHRKQLCNLLCGVVLSAGAKLHTRPG